MLDFDTQQPFARRRFSIADVERMLECGLLREDEPVELLAGELVVVSPQGPTHGALILHLTELCRTAYAGRAHARPQLPLRLSNDTLPEPDVCVARGTLRDYTRRHPGPADTLLVLEISVTSQTLDRAKAILYARAGVAEYWQLDVAARRLRIHRSPAPDDGYGDITELGVDDSVALPGTGQRYRVCDLLQP